MILRVKRKQYAKPRSRHHTKKSYLWKTLSIITSLEEISESNFE